MRRAIAAITLAAVAACGGSSSEANVQQGSIGERVLNPAAEASWLLVFQSLPTVALEDIQIEFIDGIDGFPELRQWAASQPAGKTCLKATGAELPQAPLTEGETLHIVLTSGDYQVHADTHITNEQGKAVDLNVQESAGVTVETAETGDGLSVSFSSTGNFIFGEASVTNDSSDQLSYSAATEISHNGSIMKVLARIEAHQGDDGLDLPITIFIC